MEERKAELVFNFDTPPHKCKLHIIILKEVHSVNSLHNIVIYRKSKCKICNKILEVSDPEGIK